MDLYFKHEFPFSNEYCKRRIQALIQESGLTDKEIAEKLPGEYTVQAVNKWRNGHNLPAFDNYFYLRRILGVSMDDFVPPQDIEFLIEQPKKNSNEEWLPRLKAYANYLAA